MTVSGIFPLAMSGSSYEWLSRTSSPYQDPAVHTNEVAWRTQFGYTGLKAFRPRKNLFVRLSGVSHDGDPLPSGATITYADLEFQVLVGNSGALSGLLCLLVDDGIWSTSGTLTGSRSVEASPRFLLSGSSGELVPATSSPVNTALRMRDHPLSDPYGDQRPLIHHETIGRQVTPTATGNVTSGTARLRRYGTPTGEVWLEIFADDGGGLSTGPPLATSDTVDASTLVGNPGADVTFTFSGPNQIQLTSGTDYVVMIAANTEPVGDQVCIGAMVVISNDAPGVVSGLQAGFSSNSYPNASDLPHLRDDSEAPNVAPYAGLSGLVTIPDFATGGWVNRIGDAQGNSTVRDLLQAWVTGTGRADGDPLAFHIDIETPALTASNFRQPVGIRLVAEWTPPPVLTTAVIGSGTVTVTPPGGVYASGTDLVLTASADTGWEFSQWSGGLTGSTNPSGLTITGDVTVTAVFTEVVAPTDPCDWFDPTTSGDWSADQAAGAWTSPTASGDWHAAQTAPDWLTAASGGWFTEKEC